MKQRQTKSLYERFSALVSKKPSCWLWVGATDHRGYGKIRSSDAAGQRAHRVSYALHYGTIPEGMCVLHKCDNPSCVNPEHLFLGSHKDNMNDMDSKGRRHNLKGVCNPRSKLTREEVLVIKACPNIYGAMSKLARHFGVTPSAATHVRNGLTWAHSGEPTSDHRERAIHILMK